MLETEAKTDVGYTIREAEELLGLPINTAYYRVRTGQLRVFRNRWGQMRVSPMEIVRYKTKYGANEE